MSDLTHSTGFLDLPLELRRIVYDHVLPDDLAVTFPTTRQVERDMFNLCATHDTIYDELEAWIYEKCLCNLNIIPNKESDIPSHMEFHRFRSVNITIQRPDKRSSIESLSGIRQAITLLRYGRPKLLPIVKVQFEETDDYRDPFWTQPVPWRSTFRRCVWEASFSASNMRCFHWSSGGRYYRNVDIETIKIHPVPRHTWLRVSHTSTGPIVADILDHFLDLPPCRYFSVRPLGGVSWCRIWETHNPKSRVFDRSYMTDILDAIRLWMNGDSDDDDLPRTKSEWFEPRLEQLAYSRRDGRLYCERYRPQSGG
jgi:hypothetical protein